MSEARDEHDVMVMGAGPAGAACGIFLAKAGLRVLMLEAGRHPRHHVGESLLPASVPILGRMGISGAEMAGRFQAKFGARFYDPERDRMAVFQVDPETPGAIPSFQVLREEFDAMLAGRARDAGCEIVENAVVEDVDENCDFPRVRLRGGRRLRGQFLVDATGRAAMLAAKRGTRTLIPDYGRVAFYNYFAGLPPHDDDDAQYITMYLFDEGWVWLIPLRDGRTSVGIVYQQAPSMVAAAGLAKPEALFWHAVRRMPRLEKRLIAAKATEEYRAISDYSYSVREKFGERFVLIGDAAGFLDPIFSSGVHLALHSAELAATGIVQKLRNVSDAGLAFYAAHMDRGYRVFTAFIHRFYNRGLARNLFFMRDKPPQIHAAITRILAGHVWEDENPVLKMIGVGAAGPAARGGRG